jgi:hypothetical protein
MWDDFFKLLPRIFYHIYNDLDISMATNAWIQLLIDGFGSWKLELGSAKLVLWDMLWSAGQNHFLWEFVLCND